MRAMMVASLCLGLASCAAAGNRGSSDASRSDAAPHDDAASADGTDGTDDTDGTDGTDGISGTDEGAPAEVDPSCIDGQYDEVLPSNTASIQDEKSAYSASTFRDFILSVLEKRYPTGAWLVEGGLGYDGIDCIDFFVHDKSSAQAIIGQLSTVVHECGHAFDIDQGGFSGAAYMIHEDLSFTCQGASYQGPNKTFARSLITGDEYASLHPPCEEGSFSGCDSYAGIYLDGDPTDGQFQGGDQGFDSVLEEATQYVNSLATGYAFADEYQFSVSERDGILTFLWYIERYLRLARTEHPDSYDVLINDSCWRRAILTVWGRAWLYLDATEGNSKLGLDDDLLIDLVRDPDLLVEIQRVREAEGCE